MRADEVAVALFFVLYTWIVFTIGAQHGRRQMLRSAREFTKLWLTDQKFRDKISEKINL